MDRFCFLGSDEMKLFSRLTVKRLWSLRPSQTKSLDRREKNALPADKSAAGDEKEKEKRS